MPDLTEYAMSQAPPDVRETIEWVGRNLNLVRHEGGQHEPFANLLLEFSQSSLSVLIARDRGQWSIDILPRGRSEFVGLEVLMTAMHREVPEARPRPLGVSLAEQLPEGVSWRDEVPAAIAWLMEQDRSEEIANAAREWHRAMLRRLPDS